MKITCEKPVKFGYLIEVRLVSAETHWYYVAGEKKNELAACNDQIDWIVEKALYALFSIHN